MVAEKDVTLKKAVATVYQLSEEEKFRQQCQAREDFQRQLMDRDIYFNNLFAEQKAELAAKDAALNDAKSELDDAKSELTSKDAELDDAKSELTDTSRH